MQMSSCSKQRDGQGRNGGAGALDRGAGRGLGGTDIAALGAGALLVSTGGCGKASLSVLDVVPVTGCCLPWHHPWGFLWAQVPVVSLFMGHAPDAGVPRFRPPSVPRAPFGLLIGARWMPRVRKAPRRAGEPPAWLRLRGSLSVTTAFPCSREVRLTLLVKLMAELGALTPVV